MDVAKSSETENDKKKMRMTDALKLIEIEITWIANILIELLLISVICRKIIYW